MQNREDGYWNPIKWTLKGSNNFIDFQDLDRKNLESNNANCAGNITRSFIATSDEYFSYFKFETNGKSCGGCNYFNLAEFELFGYLKKDNILTCHISKDSLIIHLSLPIFLMLS